MKLPWQHSDSYTLDEIHNFVQDLEILNEQRRDALSHDMGDEVDRLDNVIEHAQLVLERMLERVA